MNLKFTKMHGLGNDFVVVDLISQNCTLQPRHILKLADRNEGVGCDQVLLVEPPRQPDADFTYRIFNADGREVEQCGNGARCFAKFVSDQRLTGKRVMRVETKAGIIELNLTEPGNRRIGDCAQVEVNMGVPVFEPAEIPFLADCRAEEYPISAGDDELVIGALSMGNPHAVLRVDSVTAANVEILGPALEQHQRFPARTNVGFMQLLSREALKLRVYERGVGETQACGTGACAAVVYARMRDWLDNSPITVHLTGGDLLISWLGVGEPVRMTGPAATVFEGEIRL